EMETRTLRVLSGREEYPLPPDSDIGRIVRTYHAWRGETDAGDYEDVPGFCKSATLDDIKKHGFVLTPGHYIGAAAIEEDGEPFTEKYPRLIADLEECFAEAEQLTRTIRSQLANIQTPRGTA